MSKYKFGEITFTTQKAAKQYFSVMLRGAKRRFTAADPEWPVLIDLFNKHPDKEKKVKGDIVAFEIRRAVQGTNCFYVISDIEVDFSIGSCLGIKKNDLKIACRHAIRGQIQAARDLLEYHFGEKCEVCGSTEKIEVDHKTVPFQKIFEEFTTTTVAPTVFKDGGTVTTFMHTDEAYAASWAAYHDYRADYQLLCRKCNLAKGNRISS